MAAGMDHGQPTTDMPSAGPEERWISLRELAERRGISQHSAARLVRRHRWRRQTDNRGHVLALVPTEALDRPADTPTAGTGHGTVPSTGPPPGLSDAAVETVLAALRDAHAAELARVTERLDRAEAMTISLRETAIKAQADLVAVQAQAETAQEAARTAQERLEQAQRAQAAQQARGRLVKLWMALRGR